MGSNMEGNWDLAQRSAEKPTVEKGTRKYKRTFPLDHYSGQPIVEEPVDDDERILKASAGLFSGMKLMRGTWEEGHAMNTSGTFFPVTHRHAGPDASGNANASVMKKGYGRRGRERMTCGRTGVMFDALVLQAPTYFKRLHHLAADKVHARGHRGPVDSLTYQPEQGGRQGALRFGEMEVWCANAHGASALVADRLCRHSDGAIFRVHRKTGLLANAAATRVGAERCAPGGGPGGDSDNDDIVRVRMPSAFRLLVQELASVNITARIVV